MEFAIPFIALAGAYVISNQENKTQQNSKRAQNMRLKNGLKQIQREEFTNMGATKNVLPNTQIPPQNYPITNLAELSDTVQNYPNPNTATDKYFNQTYYENRQNEGKKINNEIQEVYSLTGNYLESKEFKHNNMVPFYGGKLKGQVYKMDITESILDNMNGVGSQTIQKIEQAPLFKPEKNINWANGTPNWSDFYQSRVNPGMNNANVKPFETKNVGPGLGKGYTTQGSGGYNSGMEDRNAWLPKTVNELRVDTNPKIEYTYDNLEGPASAPVKNVGIIGKTEKYRPDTFFIQTQDRWLTTTGQEIGQMLQPTQEISSDTHRNNTTQHYAGTASHLKTGSYIPKIVAPSKKTENLTHDVNHCSAVGRGTIEDKERRFQSMTNYENNRSTGLQPDTFRSSFSQAIGAVVAPIMDAFRPTRKEEYGDNLRIYGDGGSKVPAQYVKLPGDVPGVTIRDTTLYSPDFYVGNQSSAQQVIHNQQAITNQRDSTSCSYIGVASSGFNAEASREANLRQNNNDRREPLQVSYTPQGGTQIFNQHMNVNVPRIDTDRENPRMWVPNCANIAQLPMGKEQYGDIRSKQMYKENDINVTRIEGNILQAFKNNPYTQSLSSWATI
jgi:hypothetical protein